MCKKIFKLCTLYTYVCTPSVWIDNTIDTITSYDVHFPIYTALIRIRIYIVQISQYTFKSVTIMFCIFLFFFFYNNLNHTYSTIMRITLRVTASLSKINKSISRRRNTNFISTRHSLYTIDVNLTFQINNSLYHGKSKLTLQRFSLYLKETHCRTEHIFFFIFHFSFTSENKNSSWPIIKKKVFRMIGR